MEKIPQKTTLQLLELLRHKGAAWQTQDKAEATILALKMHLTGEEYRDLQIAHNHYTIGEGATEFYDVVNNLIKKYTK